MVLYNPNAALTFQSGPRLLDGDQVNQNFALAFADYGATNGIVAHAGGGQAAATALTTALNRLATVATAGDSVALPLAVAGLQITISNAAAASAQVFAQNGSPDTINGTAGATGVALAAGKTAVFTAFGPGVWHMLLSA